jgi:hypothetical protein
MIERDTKVQKCMDEEIRQRNLQKALFLRNILEASVASVHIPHLTDI